MNSKIVIIGAGASGIAAGSKLVTAGFTNLTILEAESRIGGRIDTNAFGRGCIDLGAQWCTGTVGNVVYEMAEAHGLIGPGQWRPANIQYVRSDGTIVDREILDPLFKLITLLEISDEEANDERNNGRSVGELISSRYANAIKAKEYGFVDAELAVQFLQYLQTNVNGSMASDSWFEGSQLLTWKGRGFNTVIDLLLVRDITLGGMRTFEVKCNCHSSQGIEQNPRFVQGHTARIAYPFRQNRLQHSLVQ